MKNIIKRFFAGAIVPAAVVSTLFSTNLSPTNGIEPKKFDRPYIIEIIDAKGNLVQEAKGTSSEIDPYLISSKLGANPYTKDKFSAFPSINMGIGSKITMYQTPNYTIIDGRKNIDVRSWTKTVGELLKEQNIQDIGVDDKINFAIDTRLEEGMRVEINRVAKTTVVESEKIDYNVVKKNNANMEKGTTKVTQTGSDGVRKKSYLVTREDGVEISKVLQSSEIVTEPVNEIVEVGTKVVVYGSGAASFYINTSAMIGACNLVPKGTKVHVVNLSNGKSVDITTSGGGGFSGMGRVVDLSTGAFEALGASKSQGIISNVRVEKYYPAE